MPVITASISRLLKYRTAVTMSLSNSVLLPTFAGDNTISVTLPLTNDAYSISGVAVPTSHVTLRKLGTSVGQLVALSVTALLSAA